MKLLCIPVYKGSISFEDIGSQKGTETVRMYINKDSITSIGENIDNEYNIYGSNIYTVNDVFSSPLSVEEILNYIGSYEIIGFKKDKGI